jgi:glycosyltransferase involved in cell wall biosynthesis
MNPKKYRLFFWQFMPNIHEAGYVKALSSLGYDCTVIYQSEILIQRTNLGVEIPDYGSAKTISCPKDTTLPSFIHSSNENYIHLLVGINAFNLTRRAFATLKFSPAMLILISESRRTTGFKGVLRFFHSWIFERKIRQRINGILAMGDLGVKWFNKTGYRKEIIYPFCYTVNTQNNITIPENTNKKIHLAFAGSFIDRKDPLIIINALTKLECKNIVMHWYGFGPLETTMKLNIDKYLPDCECIFHGAIKNSDLRKELQLIDILILPSKWDGWGAVINEALSAGCRVITSNYCGASSLINSDTGRVFKSGDTQDLVRQLYELISMGSLSESERKKIADWAACINADHAAQYILSVIANLKGEEQRPKPIWK